MSNNEYEQFTWRSADMRWMDISWPKFSNEAQKERPFLAVARPVGLWWEAQVTIGAQLISPKTMGSSPQEALERALENMRDAVEHVRGMS